MTSEEFAAIAKKDPVVLVPVGALEEHGRHLPLGADLIQPLHVLSDYDIIYAAHGILPEGDGHAGAGETSRILTVRPDLVKGTSPAGKNDIPAYAVVEDPRKYWSGVTGDPSKASKALGQKLDDLVIDELVRLVEELRRRA